MNKKKIIVLILVILFTIFVLWIVGIIPKHIARIYATNYLKKNYPKIELDYVDIEWNSSSDVYLIKFKDNTDKLYEFIMNNRYLPICIGHGLFEFEEDYRKKYEDIANNSKGTIVQFTRTYNIIADLNRTDLVGENNYYVIEQYQLVEPTVIKISSDYNLQENASYEFSFKGEKIDGKNYSIQEIFDKFEIVKIEKTDKTGMNQIQDEI